MRCHPDAGGDGDLFVWAQALREHVAGDLLEEPREGREPPRRTTAQDSPRVDYTEAFDKAQSFEELTRQAVALADELQEPYARLLRLLADCEEVAEIAGVVYRHQHQGATYRSCAAVAYRANMSKAERTRWYRICEGVPMSQRHIGHILSKLEKPENRGPTGEHTEDVGAA